jgi:hypothetical protein
VLLGYSLQPEQKSSRTQFTVMCKIGSKKSPLSGAEDVIHSHSKFVGGKASAATRLPQAAAVAEFPRAAKRVRQTDHTKK